MSPPPSEAIAEALWGPGGDAEAAARARLDRILEAQTDGEGRLCLAPESLERDLAKIVLAVMELLRELMELQAIRRVEAGSLTPEEEERLGAALLRSRAMLRRLARDFGLSEADLELCFGAGE